VNQQANLRGAIDKNKAHLIELTQALAQPLERPGQYGRPIRMSQRGRLRLREQQVHVERVIAELEAELLRINQLQAQRKPATPDYKLMGKHPEKYLRGTKRGLSEPEAKRRMSESQKHRRQRERAELAELRAKVAAGNGNGAPPPAPKKREVGRPSKANDYERGYALRLEHPKWSWKRIAEVVRPEEHRTDPEKAGEALRVGIYGWRKSKKVTRK
jgi:hypothetical protein